MNDEVLIKVEGVSKKFCRSLKKSMLYGVEDIIRDTLSLNTKSENLRKQEFWAVDDVSFEVRRGECLGIIGRNGAGKSTLLKMLNGIFLPDKGKITIKGKVCSLIEVGAGFHPMLSGRENIYVNGAILGMSRQEIENKFDDIVSFAELEEFIDMPVKHYSSGMYVRLGFAIAMQVEPDVLILDEVLAVGDLSFQAKSFNIIHSVVKKSAVIFVSHNMGQLSRICSNIVVLNQGKCIFQDHHVAKGIEQYNAVNRLMLKSSVSGNRKAKVHSVKLNLNDRGSENIIDYGESWSIEIDVSIDVIENNPSIALSFISQDLKFVAQCVSHFNKFKFDNNGQRMKIVLNLGNCNLNPGLYWLRLGIQGNEFGEILIRYDNYMCFEVKGDFLGVAPIQYQGDWQIMKSNAGS